MTNQPAPRDASTTDPRAAPRGKNRLAIVLALGLLVAALAVGGVAWWQSTHAGAAYMTRANAYHAAMTKVRTDLESKQPPDTVDRDWEVAKAKEKEWEDKVRDEDEKRPLTTRLRAASVLYSNAVVFYRQVHESTKAGTQPTTQATTEVEKNLRDGSTALDHAAPDLKQ
jgi:hypothetical protein